MQLWAALYNTVIAKCTDSVTTFWLFAFSFVKKQQLLEAVRVWIIHSFNNPGFESPKSEMALTYRMKFPLLFLLDEKVKHTQQHTLKQTLSALNVLLQRQLWMPLTPGTSVFTAQGTRFPVNAVGLVIRYVLTWNPPHAGLSMVLWDQGSLAPQFVWIYSSWMTGLKAEKYKNSLK